MIIISILFFIHSHNSKQEIDSTILLEIKTWKYTNNNNFNYYLNFNPHANYKLSENDPKFIYLDLILNNIYTDIFIGSPPEKILGFFAGKINTFTIFYFNKTKSKTLNILINEDNNIKCSDNFMFNCENKIYELEGMEFLKTQYSSLKLSHSYLGLQISAIDIEKMKKYNNDNDKYKINFNFVESLQKAYCRKLNISNYYWTIKYLEPQNNPSKSETYNIDGIFYFGEPPHIYDPNNYNKDDFVEINTESGYDNLYWGLKFDNVEFINKTTGSIISLGKYASTEFCLIYPELNYFITTEIFFSRIKKNFFQKFMAKNKKKENNDNASICYEQFVSLIDDINLLSVGNYNDLKGIYDTFHCNKTKILEYGEEKFYNEFPLIKFNHLFLGFSFEFDAKDLFYEKNGTVYFLMAIKLNMGDRWIFGKAFMKKYQIVFNNDMRTLGFYLNNNNKKIIKPKEIINYVDNKQNKNIFLLFIIDFIFIVAILYIIRIFCIKNKIWIFKDKRNAKELELINKSIEFF